MWRYERGNCNDDGSDVPYDAIHGTYEEIYEKVYHLFGADVCSVFGWNSIKKIRVDMEEWYFIVEKED